VLVMQGRARLEIAQPILAFLMAQNAICLCYGWVIYSFIDLLWCTRKSTKIVVFIVVCTDSS
jgi:hypothetical protein